MNVEDNGMAIQVVRQDEIPQVLKHAGPVGIPLSQPPCLLRTAPRTINEKEHVETGFWECSPGKFRREIVQGEIMHILSGACSFAPDDGVPIELKAGDTAFFPPQTTGTWEIRKTVRKVYVLV
ncbi:PF05899 family protein [Bordetella bronchiseptica 99-R-0433]|nr:PF05899 family protein [Bordetella bronchiseptica 99-R-0433]